MTGRARRWALRHLVGHEGEICHVCGSRYSAFVWWADSELWDAVAGNRYGLLCPRCFTRLADEKGVWVCWAALPHDTWGDFVEVDVKATIATWQTSRGRTTDRPDELTNDPVAFVRSWLCHWGVDRPDEFAKQLVDDLRPFFEPGSV